MAQIVLFLKYRFLEQKTKEGFDMGLLEIDNYNKLKMNKKLAGFYHKKMFSDYELTARFYERGIKKKKKYKYSEEIFTWVTGQSLATKNNSQEKNVRELLSEENLNAVFKLNSCKKKKL